MEEKDDAIIERYYLGDLNETELADFQRRMAEDVVFWEAVQLHADALEAIRLDGIALLRKRLHARGLELDAGAGRPGRRRPWWMAGLLIVLPGIWAVWRWMQPANEPAPVPVMEKQMLPAPAATDTTPALNPSEKPSQPAPKTTDHKRVFAAWFRPYKDPSLEPVRRGDGEQSPSERFQQLYWEGNYDAALAAFDSLGTFARNNDNLLFLKANCLLATAKAAEADALLEKLLQNPDSRYKAQYNWYLALSRLRAGRTGEAGALLRRIATDPDSPRRTDAERLLRDLK